MEPEVEFLKNWVEKDRRPFTINRLRNSEMLNLILEYYVGRSGEAIDVTYGSGSFWIRKLPLWKLDKFDKEPMDPLCREATWEKIPALVNKRYDAVVFDPPYTPKSQKSGSGMELDKIARGYRGSKRNASITESMKYGDSPLESAYSAFLELLKPDALLIYKNQELQEIPYFYLYDYLIQDNGFQPDGFKLSKPKARPNHAFWMIFKSV